MVDATGAKPSRTSTLAIALSLLAIGAAGCDGEKKNDAANSPKAEAAPDGDKAADAAPIVGKPVEGDKGAVAKKPASKDEPTYTFSVQKNDSYKR